MCHETQIFRQFWLDIPNWSSVMNNNILDIEKMQRQFCFIFQFRLVSELLYEGILFSSQSNSFIGKTHCQDWGAHRHFFLCEMRSMLFLKKCLQPPHGKVGKGSGFGVLWLLLGLFVSSIFSSGAFEGCCFFSQTALLLLFFFYCSYCFPIDH